MILWLVVVADSSSDKASSIKASSLMAISETSCVIMEKIVMLNDLFEEDIINL